MTSKPDTKDNKQIAAFRKAARAAGCDDNEERFQDALRKVAKAKPSDRVGGRARKAPSRE
jgi:hypothetical protein